EELLDQRLGSGAVALRQVEEALQQPGPHLAVAGLLTATHLQLVGQRLDERQAVGLLRHAKRGGQPGWPTFGAALLPLLQQQQQPLLVEPRAAAATSAGAGGPARSSSAAAGWRRSRAAAPGARARRSGRAPSTAQPRPAPRRPARCPGAMRRGTSAR